MKKILAIVCINFFMLQAQAQTDDEKKKNEDNISRLNGIGRISSGDFTLDVDSVKEDSIYFFRDSTKTHTFSIGYLSGFPNYSIKFGAEYDPAERKKAHVKFEDVEVMRHSINITTAIDEFDLKYIDTTHCGTTPLDSTITYPILEYTITDKELKKNFVYVKVHFSRPVKVRYYIFTDYNGPEESEKSGYFYSNDVYYIVMKGEEQLFCNGLIEAKLFQEKKSEFPK